MNLTDANHMVLSAAFFHGPRVWEFIPPEQLEDPWRQIGLIIHGMQVRGTDVDITSLMSEGAKRGVNIRFDRWITSDHVTAEDAASTWHEANAVQTIDRLLVRGKDMIDRGVDHWDVLDEIVTTAETLKRPEIITGTPWYDFEEVMAFNQADTEWVIEGLLARRERLVLTGKEGYGKSTLVYQLAFGAAYGVNPVNTTMFEPKRVLILDVENSHETQVANQYRLMVNRYARWAPDGFVPELKLMKIRDIDMANPENRRSLIEAIELFQPDLLTAGSGYKLADAPEWRDKATAVQRTLDMAKARTGCAVILETHAGHGEKNDRNGYRPEGSADWLKWPEFGHGLKEHESSPRVLEIAPWRGNRVEGRIWPHAWRRDPNGLPWQAIDKREMDLIVDSQGW